jgi:hypothetical protein
VYEKDFDDRSTGLLSRIRGGWPGFGANITRGPRGAETLRSALPGASQRSVAAVPFASARSTTRV